LKELEKQKQAAGGENGQFMPPDASSRLSTLSQALPQQSLKARAMAFLSLTKPRLSFLITLTTTTAYSLYPVPAVLSPTVTTAPSLSTLTLTFLTIGTGLACASANTFNMLYETKWDAIMSRTRNRPLVRGLVSKRAAAIFGIATGVMGVTALYFGVNPTTAALGAANIVIYAGIYTSMKRLSAANTWAGAIVGGIPPLMGWTAAAGQVSTTTQPGEAQWKELLFSEESIGGWLLAALLFAWQFPHFNALSWPVRDEYKAAGHRMLAWTNPARNARVALRYAFLMFPICWGLSAAGVVEPAFVPASAVVNGWMAYEAVKFWKHQGYKGSARGLFWASVWHLPVVMVLAMGMKQGLWQRVKTGIFGVGEDDEEWDD
jgi:heme o synthase